MTALCRFENARVADFCVLGHQSGEGLSSLSLTGLVKMHSDVTVLVVDIHDFLYYVQALERHELAALINNLYDRFDAIAKEHMLTRIIEDSYMLVLEDNEMSSEVLSHQVRVGVSSGH